MKTKLPRIAITMANALPVPSVMGGAVEELITILAEQNEVQKKAIIEIFSPYHAQAKKISAKWKYTKVHYIKNDYFWNHVKGSISSRLFHKELFPYGQYCAKIFDSLLKNNYDKIVAANFGYDEAFRLLDGKIDKSKLYIYIHYHYLATENIKYNFSKVLAVSDYINQEWLRTCAPAKYQSYTVRNCVKTERFARKSSVQDRNELRAKLGLSDDDFVVSYTGRISQEKGVLELLQAIAKCNLEKVKLLLVGSTYFATDRKSEYEKEVEKLLESIGDKVVKTGYVANEELYRYYQISDVQVMPSLCEEACGLVAIEGMLSGVPLIVTNSGGLVEYVDPECAVILDKEDKEKLITDIAHSIETLYNDPNARKKMSEHGMERGKMFNPKRYYDEFIDAVLTD